MDRNLAHKIYHRYCKVGKREPGAVKEIQEADGSWRFVEQESLESNGEYGGVVIRKGEKVFVFRGALGKVFRTNPRLGLPTSNELVLGATELGRYQNFDHGVAIWDGGTTIGFPLVESLTPLKRQMCIVAFFDLRGFTSWAAKEEPDAVQKIIRIFENAVHIGFPTDGQPWLRLSIKGTGDGVMIVSQADWYEDDNLNSQMQDFKRKHARDFLTGCQVAMASGWKPLRKSRLPLAIGCGIATGLLDRVFLFGRLDFIGPAANEAAKLQQHAWDEICITDQFKTLLERDGQSVTGAMQLRGKGWRLRSGWSISTHEK
jgi:class 3 adenylate cyclase